jgi:hypothetical protein
MSHVAREVLVPAPTPPLGTQLLRAFEEDELSPSVEEQERYVRDDDDGYSA